MDRSEIIKQEIKQQGILPLFYHDDAETCMQVTRALYDAGVRAIEFTNRGEAALSNFKMLVETRSEMQDLLLGVGTIRTAEQANQFIAAGADFLISPVFDFAIADAAYLSKVLWIPGCMTPTEIHMAEQAGCTMIKLFPGNVLGPSFVSGIRELFPKIDFMPTGGVEVDKENINAWLDAGVCAVGMGSKLISKKDLEKKQYDKIAQRTRKALKIINDSRS